MILSLSSSVVMSKLYKDGGKSFVKEMRLENESNERSHSVI